MSVTLTQAEIDDLTQYRQASKQAEELRQRGFLLVGVVRGKVWLPREHYLAVCRGEYGKPKEAGYSNRPTINRAAVHEAI
ncbi:Domain of unknown function DUF4224 [uncultured Caudovirales phage]|uniref:Uncharacterized protein n=1 Tax=uncultured Caudovirales phage TaxID=2100421 RepID=A0A6J5T3U5_9CAUD|nr:Domain of unknown function DUF4224 [uncultured Caudovirales phage]CAB4168922.1 Domain of unknown function DUF4224 [uncultured Caudovirales phage]CAB4180802.1 Domain of unknown function DUF4224 [uncultured Caudovirales phage]CAB4195428.1 Domain of unknown function DUF4224 [uncultured Caudovirales phage]CAB4221916.1 Domain of unknown function DUF4224 [uncultured Caudovirales phage]